MISPETVGVFVSSILLGVGILALIVVPPAYHARKRGYNPFVWGLAALLAQNPIFLLVVLAMAPHRARVRLREQFTRELDAKLAALESVPPTAADPASPRIDTSAVGDRPTVLPPDRSIGDEQTRL